MASQSPTEGEDASEYQDAWAAVSRLMDSGASWSGHERNCAYLNLGDGRFADVSAVANPATGVAVYDSFPYQGTSGWMVFGGTSVSAPIVAGVYALAGNASSLSYGSYPYSHSGSLLDLR